MTGATHQAGALLAAGFYAQALGFSPALTVVTAAGAFAAACLPDTGYDPEAGDPGRYEHRGLPHSLVLAGGLVCLAALVAVALFGYPALDAGGDGPLVQAVVSLSGSDPEGLVAVAAVGAALGYVSHLLLDGLTTKGIWLMSPGGRRIGAPLVKKGRVPEPLVLLVITLALLPVLVIPLVNQAAPW